MSTPSTCPVPPPAERTLPALEALNFFMADMQAGIGPFLSVFLQQRSWQLGPIGTVMTVGGVAGVLVTAPAGALVDATTRKRTYVILSGVATVLAGALLLFHLGNGAMLPLYGLAVVAKGRANPAAFVAMTVVVAQAVMIVASLVAMRMSDHLHRAADITGWASGRCRPSTGSERDCRAWPFPAWWPGCSTAPGASTSARARR